VPRVRIEFPFVDAQQRVPTVQFFATATRISLYGPTWNPFGASKPDSVGCLKRANISLAVAGSL